MIEKHYSPAELARILSVDRKTIYNRIADGALEAIAFGDRWLIPESAIQRVLDQGRTNRPKRLRPGPQPIAASL